MIYWKHLQEYSDAEKRRWRKDFCSDAVRESDGRCLGYGNADDDEPCAICKSCSELRIEVN